MQVNVTTSINPVSAWTLRQQTDQIGRLSPRCNATQVWWQFTDGPTVIQHTQKRSAHTPTPRFCLQDLQVFLFFLLLSRAAIITIIMILKQIKHMPFKLVISIIWVSASSQLGLMTFRSGGRHQALGRWFITSVECSGIIRPLMSSLTPNLWVTRWGSTGTDSSRSPEIPSCLQNDITISTGAGWWTSGKHVVWFHFWPGVFLCGVYMLSSCLTEHLCVLQLPLTCKSMQRLIGRSTLSVSVNGWMVNRSNRRW